MIKIKRVYEAEDKSDGYRVLVDRLWPRGMKKTELHFDEWPKEICPSSELRKIFGHDPSRFSEFKKDYKKELKSEEAKKEIEFLSKLAQKRNVTLLYAAHDEKINHAIVLKEVLDHKSKISN
jgi:uncharacterized protein YeaO (DUF488 family)